MEAVDKNYIRRSRIKRRILKNTNLVRVFLLAGLVGVFVLVFSLLGQIFGSLKISDYFLYTKNFVFTPESSSEKFMGRTNILILGKGGADHEAPDLTDTIIFSSISHERGDIVLLSLPRDIWVPEIRAKLNSAYYWGNQKEEGGGTILSKALVEKIVGVPIHYSVVVDFSGFKDLIDTLGGVEVDVENSFVDERFPISGREDDDCDGDFEFKCRYETVSFEEGLQEMDGETALKFVRSRNSKGDEGTDLARAKRQQKIISAIKDKVLSWATLKSPKKLASVVEVVRKNVETDILDSVGAVLARRVLQTRNQMESVVVPEEFLVNPRTSSRYDNLYVFIPASDTWEELNQWVEKLLN